MARWTQQQYNEWLAKQLPRASDAGKPRPKLQEFKDDRAREAHHGPQKTEVDGRVHSKFHVAITLLVSDERERDGDGAEATLLDCLIHARERLLSLPDSVLLELLQVSKRTGGR